MGPHKQVITALDAPAAIGPYSHAVRSGGLLFCSAQIPLDPSTGELAGNHPAEQAQRALANLQAVCAAAGAGLADAVRVTLYLVDLAFFDEVNEVYASFFREEHPARVTVGAAALPRGALVAVDAIVAVPG